MKFLLSFLLPLLSLIPSLTAAAMPYVFSRLDASDGLSDNQVQHILQLPDDARTLRLEHGGLQRHTFI